MLKLAHARAVGLAFLTWCSGFLWLWPRAVRAATLEAEFRVYDWTSMFYAGCLGLLGGMLALIVALASDKRVVMEVVKESGRNALVSPIAGAGAYLLLKTIASLGWLTLSTEPRFLIIVGSGWAGIAFFQLVREGAGKLAVALASWLVKRGTP
ncbi:MAG TPA: hypothetical protein VIL30_17575 [Ramlibacter sp.]|jgi:hypothetical protein